MKWSRAESEKFGSDAIIQANSECVLYYYYYYYY